MALHLKDVATQAGVSTATASRVLRDVPGVSERARAAVLNAVDALGYRRPDFAAPTAGPVGVVVVKRLSAVLDPMTEFKQHLVARLAARGLTTSILPVRPDSGADGEVSAIDTLRRAGASALVVLTGRGPVETDPAVRAYRAAAFDGVPVVMAAAPLAGTDVPDWQEGPARIRVDGAAAMDTCVKHLVDIGHRRIALTLPERSERAGTAQGFRQSMAARLHIVGSRAEAPVKVSFESVEAGAQTAGELIDGGSTAIITGSPALTLGALRAAADRRMGVPEHVSIIGYGDIPGAHGLGPPLTVARIPGRRIADAAADEIIRRLDTRPPAPGTIARTSPDLTFHAELVVRSSTAPPLRR